MKKFIPLLVSVVVIGIWYIAFLCIGNPACLYADLSWNLMEAGLKSVSGFCIAVLPISIILIFTKRGVSSAVGKFAIFWIPLSLILVALTPDTGGLPPLAISKEFVVFLMGGLFTLISLILIAWKTFKKS